jgi:hypothetical protein
MEDDMVAFCALTGVVSKSACLAVTDGIGGRKLLQGDRMFLKKLSKRISEDLPDRVTATHRRSSANR